MGNYIGFFIVAAILAIFFFMHAQKPAETLNGRKLVPTKTEWEAVRTKSEVDADAKITIKYPDRSVSVPLSVRDNQLYVGEAESTGPAPEVHAESKRYAYGFNPMFDRLDLGAWAGFRSSSEDKFQVGVRIGAFRFLNDSFSCDGIFGPKTVGVGISIHPPPDKFPGYWKHLGLGFARAFDPSLGDVNNVFYISFNTR